MANSVAAYLMAHARRYGLDPKAVIAVARQEGLGGGVGDHGTSFGPFQLHEGGALPKGIPLDQAQAWAESPAGLNYALSRIAAVAKGQRGAQAIQSIVSRFERPADVAGEIAGAEHAYGGGLGSSPALEVMQRVSGAVGGSPSALGSPQQLMSEYLLSQAQAGLSGSGSVQQQGEGLLQMAMARKALQSMATPTGGGTAAHRAESSPGLVSYKGISKGGYSNIVTDPGVNISKVDPKLLQAINQVARAHGVKVTINSGYRSPAHSVAVGGFANDPHTRGVAVDAYVNGKPIGEVFGPSVWSRLGVQSGNVPNFYNGKPDPEHLQIG